MCNYLTYYYTCGYHASSRLRTAECLHAANPPRCRDEDRTIVLPGHCKYCATGQRSASHPGTTFLPTPPPSPDSEDEQKVVWIVPSRCELFHRQKGFRCYDPFAADREKVAEKRARVKELKLQPATRAEPIELDDEVRENPLVNGGDEDPFGPAGIGPRLEKKWKLTFLGQRKKPIRTSRCCMEAGSPTYGIPGYIVDDRYRSNVRGAGSTCSVRRRC